VHCSIIQYLIDPLILLWSQFIRFVTVQSRYTDALLIFYWTILYFALYCQEAIVHIYWQSV